MLKRLFAFALSLALVNQPLFAQSLPTGFGASKLTYQAKASVGSRNCGSIHRPVSSGTATHANLDELVETLKNIQKLSKTEEIEGRLNVTDLPMWSRQAKRYVAEITNVLKQMGLSDIIEVKAHYIPTRSGVTGAVEKFRYLFPMKQDYEKPIPDEMRKGAPGVIVAESMASFYALMAMPREASLPLLLSHFSLLATVTALQKSSANWRARTAFPGGSATLQTVRAAEGIAKEAAMSFVFVFNYKVSSNLHTIYKTFQERGLGALHDFAQSAGQFAADQGLTTVLQTAFFYVTFQRGGFRWMTLTQDDPVLAEGSRRAMSIITPSVFMISGPMVMWAATSKAAPMFSIAGLDFNGGHVGLMALTAAGGIVAYNPLILNSTIPYIDRYVHGPLNRGAARIRDRYRSLMEWAKGSQ